MSTFIEKPVARQCVCDVQKDLEFPVLFDELYCERYVVQRSHSFGNFRTQSSVNTYKSHGSLTNLCAFNDGDDYFYMGSSLLSPSSIAQESYQDMKKIEFSKQLSITAPATEDDHFRVGISFEAPARLNSPPRFFPPRPRSSTITCGDRNLSFCCLETSRGPSM